MSDAKFTKGEKVRRLEGGSVMTVERVTRNRSNGTFTIECSYLTGSRPMRVRYPQEALKREENPDSAAETMSVMKLGPDYYRVSITGNHWTAVKRRGMWEVVNALGRSLAAGGDRHTRVLNAIAAFDRGEVLPKAGKG